MDGFLVVQERHPRTYISDDLPRLFLGKGVLGFLKQRAEVPAGEQLHDENQTVRKRRDRPVHVDCVGTPEANHGIQLAQKSPVLAIASLSTKLSPIPSLENIILADFVVEMKYLRCWATAKQNL